MTDTGAGGAGRRNEVAAGDRRQIDFDPLQTHKKSFERAVIAVAIICMIVVLFIVLATSLGNEFRPTA